MLSNSITKLSKESLNHIYEYVVNNFQPPQLKEIGGGFKFDSNVGNKEQLCINNIIEIDVIISGACENGVVWFNDLELQGWIEGEEIKLNIPDSLWVVFEKKIEAFIKDYFRE